MCCEIRLSIVLRIRLSLARIFTARKFLSGLKYMGCGAKSISDIRWAKLQAFEDAAELRAEEAECCEASSHESDRAMGLNGCEVFLVLLLWTSMVYLLHLFNGGGGAVAGAFIVFG